MRLPPLKSIWYFEATARHLSFTKAGEELSVTHSAISQQIKLLEEWLGHSLFERSPRNLSLSEAGRRFLPPVRSAFQQLGDAATDMRRYPRNKPLTISILPSIATKWLVPRLPGFKAEHPDIDVRISATESLEPIGLADIDVGLRYGLGQWPGLQSELLLADRIYPVCSPKLLEGPRPLLAPGDLVHFSLITDAEWRSSSYDFWPHWLAAAGISDLDARIGLTFNQSSLMVQAAIDGLGVALVNSMLAADDIRAGRLVRPFALSVTLETGYYLAYAMGALRQPKIMAFRGWIHEQMRQFHDPEMAP